MNNASPKIAIVDPNTLAALGLRQLLQSILYNLRIDVFGTMSELLANHPEEYFHFFVATNIVVSNRNFFLEHRRKTIVLTLSLDSGGQLPEFNCVCVNVPEKELVRSLLKLSHHAHANGKNLPKDAPTASGRSLLSNREIEVMSLIVQGYINKEIADRLNIGLSTVVTHRKNIMEKLGARSVSSLTVYAVMHGYVDINTI